MLEGCIENYDKLLVDVGIPNSLLELNAARAFAIQNNVDILVLFCDSRSHGITIPDESGKEMRVLGAHMLRGDSSSGLGARTIVPLIWNLNHFAAIQSTDNMQDLFLVPVLPDNNFHDVGYLDPSWQTFIVLPSNTEALLQGEYLFVRSVVLLSFNLKR